jgi:uncharacterized membrane protein (UPF0127 family)
MKTQKISFKYKNKRISLEVHKCNFIKRGVGLMFSRKENAKALLFEFPKPVKMSIHSFFVFFPFLTIWLDDKNKIIEIKKIYPWNPSVFPKEKFKKLIEIPFSRRYFNLLKSLDED